MTSRYKKLAPYLIIFLIALLIYLNVFLNPGFLVKSDSPVHMVEAQYLADTLIPEYHWINGWLPFELAGNPTQVYTYQLGIWLVVILLYLGINLFLAYKLAVFLAILAVPLALFYVLRKRFPLLPSLIVASSFLFLRDFTKVYLAGMWAQGLGIALLILLIDYLASHLKLNLRDSLIAAIFLALIILAHPFVTIVAGYTIGAAFLVSLYRKKGLEAKNLSLYILLFVFGIALSWFYLYPYLDTFGWFETTYGWGLGASISEIFYRLVGIFFSLKPQTALFNPLFSGQVLLALKVFLRSVVENLPVLLVDLFGIIGFVKYIKKKNRDNLLDLLIIFLVVSLVLGSGFWFLFSWGSSLPFFGAMLSYRFVYVAKIALFVFAAYGLTELLKSRWKSFTTSIIRITIIIIFIALFLGAYDPPESYSVTSGLTPIYPESMEMWSWVKENVPYDARIFNQNFFGNVKEPLVTFDSITPAMANYYTGHQYVGAWYTTVYPLEYLNSEERTVLGLKIEDADPSELPPLMETYNIKYAIAVSDELKDLFSSSGSFSLIYESENYKIFSLDEYEPSWASGNLDFGLESFEEQELIFNIENDIPDNPFTVKVAYHPYWKAFVDGEEMHLAADENDLITMELPEGDYKLNLIYNPIRWGHIFISILALLALIFLFKRSSQKEI